MLQLQLTQNVRKSWPVLYLQPIVSKLVQPANLTSIQLWLRLEVLKGVMISTYHNMAINQITEPLATGLDNGKHFTIMYGIVTLN